MRVVYVCEQCGHEQQPLCKTDWTCKLCGVVVRTANELPAGWLAANLPQGDLIAFCVECQARFAGASVGSGRGSIEP